MIISTCLSVRPEWIGIGVHRIKDHVMSCKHNSSTHSIQYSMKQGCKLKSQHKYKISS